MTSRLQRAVAAIAFALPIAATAQTSWPNKPLKWVVPFATGGMTDILGRTIGPRLGEALGFPVLVENRPGTAGGVGSEYVAKSAPDGYTLLGGTISSHAINASLYSRLPYDPLKDFVPVTMLVTLPNMLVVNPSLPVNNVKELIAWLKANPGKASFGSSGNGTSIHLAGELFKSVTATEMQHIPYKGSSQVITALLGGELQLAFDNITTAWPQARAGKLRALGVTLRVRSSIAPDVPTIEEAGGLPGFEVGSWQGLFVPAGTPPAIVNRLNTEVVKILRTPDIRQKFIDLGCEPIGNTSEEFTAVVRAEVAKWAKVVKDSGARVD